MTACIHLYVCVCVSMLEIGFLSLTLHYGIYGNDGMGVKQIKVIGKLISKNNNWAINKS